MAVEFDPNEFRRQNFGNVPQQPQAVPHPQAPAPMEAPAPIAPAPMQAPIPAQGQPQPYVLPQQPPAHYQPQPQGQPAQFVPGQPYPAPQAEYAAPPQGYVQQAQPYVETPRGIEEPVEQTSKLSRFKRRPKGPKAPRTPKPPRTAGANSGFAKPFVAGLLSGVVMTVIGVSVLGSMAKKSMDKQFADIATAVQQPVEIPTEIAEVVVQEEATPNE